MRPLASQAQGLPFRATPLPPPPPPAPVQAPAPLPPYAPRPGEVDSPWASHAPNATARRTVLGREQAPSLPNPAGLPTTSDGTPVVAVAPVQKTEKRDPPAEKAAEPSSLPAGEALKLLWVDGQAMLRLRRDVRWQELVFRSELSEPARGGADAQQEGSDADEDDNEDIFDAAEDETAGESPEDRDRRHALAVLTRTPMAEAPEIQRRAQQAVSGASIFEAPLVAASGDIEFAFCEVEVLKATVTTIAPVAGNDRNLKELLDAANDLLKAPLLDHAGPLADALTQKLREAFREGRRALPNDYLPSHTERMLLQQRAYQKRTVYGSAHLRAMWLAPGAAAPIPCYLPATLAPDLPASKKLKVRVLTEVDTAQDPFEEHALCLRPVALARVLKLS